MRPGPDPDFPYLTEGERFSFPSPEKARKDIVAFGGNLSPGMLLSAYEQGIFPWYNPGDPVIWQSPDPRFVILPGNLHISSSMKRVLKRGDFEITLDRDFEGVIRSCADIDRPGQGGTWITPDMIEAYIRLHRLGFAHSAESYVGGRLAGGCYGVELGRAFFGESMFSREDNASKAAFLTLAQRLFSGATAFIDCQVYTRHLESLGGIEMKRSAYLRLLRETPADRNTPGSGDIWGRPVPLIPRQDP
jgi:leucyl/phenylalanyl-tRNA--protein transferase